MANKARKPHVISDRESRLLKSEKIVRLIGKERFMSLEKALEVGCGSGVICSALATAGSDRLKMFAVDVADNRVEREGYTFAQIEDTRLPFPDGSFDLVISNHVIEHVGDSDAQLDHLKEIRRVLKPDGLAYLAMPNKWRLIEPHYRLPFLSWLPQNLGDAFVRVTRKGTYYDCRPLSAGRLNQLFDDAEMSAQDMTINALRATLETEHRDHFITRLVNGAIPDRLLATSLLIVPTLVYLLQPKPL